MIPLNVILASLLAGLGLLFNAATTDLVLGCEQSSFPLLEILFGGLPRAFQAPDESKHQVAATGPDASNSIVPLPQISVIIPANIVTSVALIQTVDLLQPVTLALPTSIPVNATIASVDPANGSIAPNCSIAEVSTAATPSFDASNEASNDTVSVTIPAAHRPQKASNTRSRSLRF
ncbi:hypothetical protein BV25DRAFT_1990214 [Artomyces pyxidatus]|uniref:Uncharacterized protein n=1 Tax=Artomyces pyxidatus TaxID=48021 RepID=A0ACB8T6H9_9AGAM|nr:hypothetical protein BV25DRAFT_1990214 [Artomyces pyxidatus]